MTENMTFLVLGIIVGMLMIIVTTSILEVFDRRRIRREHCRK